MNWSDFFIGFFLMNAMPHLILGVWKQKMLSGFGLGNGRNILWSLFNLIVSVSLFVFSYGFNGFREHAIYTGALVVLVTFYFTAVFWKNYYKSK